MSGNRLTPEMFWDAIDKFEREVGGSAHELVIVPAGNGYFHYDWGDNYLFITAAQAADLGLPLP